MENRINRNTAIKAIIGIPLGLTVPAILTSCGGEAQRSPKKELKRPLVIPAPFENPVANEVAHELGYTPASFFTPSRQNVERLSAFLNHDLYPIYPPAVIEQKQLIYQLSDKHGIPSNVIATIMSIESAGKADAMSPGVYAQGLFQVMPFNFPFVPSDWENAWPKYRTRMQNPETNGEAAMSEFTRRLKESRVNNPFPANSAMTYIRAAMGYNRGGPGTSLLFDQAGLTDQTRYYGDDVVRYMLTMQMADGLRKRGFSDQHILQALSSREIDARAYALSNAMQNVASYDEYRTIIKNLALPEPGLTIKGMPTSTLVEKLHKDYEDELHHQYYHIPASPGLRIWLASGGLSLFEESPDNIDLNIWQSISTQR